MMTGESSYVLTWLWMAIVAGPVLLMAIWKRIFPHTPLLFLLLVPCLGSLLVLAWPELLLVVLTIDAAIGVVALIDLASLPRRRWIQVERNTTRTASLKNPHPVSLLISNPTRRSFFALIRDDLPQECVAIPSEFVVKLGPRSRSTLEYTLKPGRRGAFLLEHVHLRVRSLFGFWQRYLQYPVVSEVNVYPDMVQLSEYALLARTNRLSLMGVRRTRKVGQDHEFERLRDYTLDDNYKHMDWRTTARRSKLTVKDFQTSHSQRIIFLMDCGRMMTNEAGGVSLLDHSMNAMLMLSYVALRQGDSVGMIAFSDQTHTYVPPHGGMNQMNRLLHASYDRFPKLVESRYDEAFMYLATHCKKRALVVLATNIIDEVNAHQVHRYLATQVGRHLPVGVLLRDHRIFDAADQPQPRGSDLYRAAAAAEILTWRHQVLTDLEHSGVLCLDVFPEDMTAPLVNMYLNVKARHLL